MGGAHKPPGPIFAADVQLQLPGPTQVHGVFSLDSLVRFLVQALATTHVVTLTSVAGHYRHVGIENFNLGST